MWPRLGVSTAGYTAEGGFNGPGQPSNNWLWWERCGRAPVAGAGAGLWRAPDGVLDRAAAMGCETVGLSVEWARVEPAVGRRDPDAVAGYRALLEGCRSRGLEPVVTLCHFTHPSWLGEEFWLTPGAPDRFAGHAAATATELGDLCGHWVTLHEPATAALEGWVRGRMPPGRRLAPADAWAALDNMVAGHLLAAAELTRACPDARVALGVRADDIYELGGLPADLAGWGGAGVAADGLDGWVDDRRAVHDAAHPPRRAADLWRRRVAAALAPYGSDAAGVLGLGGGLAPAAAVRRALRRPSPRRAVTVAAGHPGGAAAVALSFPEHAPSLGAWCRAHGQVSGDAGQWVVGGGPGAATAAVAARAAGAPVERYLQRWAPGPARPTGRRDAFEDAGRRRGGGDAEVGAALGRARRARDGGTPAG